MEGDPPMMNYKSNVDAVLGKLRSLFSPKAMDDMQLEIAQNLYASNAHRVHNEGLAVSGGSIGKYSTRAGYFTAAATRAIQPKGKTGKTVFKNGKPHKTRYFANGYRGYKTALGFNASKVNMQLTGRLKADWVVLKSFNGYVIGFASSYGKNVSIGNEQRFQKPIWGVTSADKKVNGLIIKRYLAKLK